MVEFQSIDDMRDCMERNGALEIYCKFLAENDNVKQQIYLGGSFEILKLLPFGEIRTDPGGKRPNYKAPINLFWLDATGNLAQAPGAQLILYPDYPEVRLSGFVRACPIAPSRHLQPIPREQRSHNNGPDGRVLFFGVAPNRVLAYLAPNGSAISRSMQKEPPPRALAQSDILRAISRHRKKPTRETLLDRLRDICLPMETWHPSMKLNRNMQRVPYSARNGGGYTLEALLGIVPNGRSAPDYLGWEIKAYSQSRITLMTPEPDAGYYGEHGVEAFLRRYGRKIAGDVLYFTGTHKFGMPSKASGHTLSLRGFDVGRRKIMDVDGGICLLDKNGELAAKWTFSGLIEHWGRKHAAAAYIPFKKSNDKPPKYCYMSPVLLGEGTDFSLFLSALAARKIVYDPGSKLINASSGRPATKARSQFRVSLKDLASLYAKLEQVPL